MSAIAAITGHPFHGSRHIVPLFRVWVIVVRGWERLIFQPLKGTIVQGLFVRLNFGLPAGCLWGFLLVNIPSVPEVGQGVPEVGQDRTAEPLGGALSPRCKAQSSPWADGAFIICDSASGATDMWPLASSVT